MFIHTYIYIPTIYTKFNLFCLGEIAPLQGSVQDPKRHGQLLLAHLANFPIAGRAGWPKHVAVRTWLLLYQVCLKGRAKQVSPLATVLLKALELQFFELFGVKKNQMPLVFEGC